MHICLLYCIFFATGFPDCARFSSLINRTLFGGYLVLPGYGLGINGDTALDATVSYIAPTQHRWHSILLIIVL